MALFWRLIAGIDNKECLATLALSDALTKRLDFIHFLLYIKVIREIVQFIAFGVDSAINANRPRGGLDEQSTHTFK